MSLANRCRTKNSRPNRTKNIRANRKKNPNFYLSNNKTLKLNPRREQISIFMTMLLLKKAWSLPPPNRLFLKGPTVLEVLWANKKGRNKKQSQSKLNRNLSNPTKLVSSRNSRRRWVWWRGQSWSTMRSLLMDLTAKTVIEIVTIWTRNNLETLIVLNSREAHSRSSQRSKSAKIT